MAEELDNKAELVRETCSISSLFSACTHRAARSPHRPPFIDWYLVLGVEEEAGIDVIRRQYRRLGIDWPDALLLHPDKNSHPKAEAAFKVVSEAYECLSDEARRKAFNSERQQNFCSECHDSRSRPNLSNPKTGNASGKPSGAGAQTKLRKALAALKEARKRFQEECRVIDTCLRANRATSQGGSPLFDPSLYVVCTGGYPHCRDRLRHEHEHEHEQSRWSSGDGGRRKGKCESPLYEVRTERRARTATPNFSYRY